MRAGLDDLPSPVLLLVLLFMPLVDRVRSCLVSRCWAALLDDPDFWSRLDFRGARINNVSLLQILSRSAGGLRSLDLSGPPILPQPNMPAGTHLQYSRCLSLLQYMASQGLTANLETLRTVEPPGKEKEDLDSAEAAQSVMQAYVRPGIPCYRWGEFALFSADDARRLREACPALRDASVKILGIWQGVTGAMCALSCAAGGCEVIICGSTDTRCWRRTGSSAPLAGTSRQEQQAAAEAALQGGFVAFAAALSEAVQCCAVDSLDIGIVHEWKEDPTRPIIIATDKLLVADALFLRASDPEAAEAAAKQLAGVLASREHGPRKIRLIIDGARGGRAPDGNGSDGGGGWRGVPAMSEEAAPSSFSRLLWRALTPESPLRKVSIRYGSAGDGAFDPDAVDKLSAMLQPTTTPGGRTGAPIERFDWFGKLDVPAASSRRAASAALPAPAAVAKKHEIMLWVVCLIVLAAFLSDRVPSADFSSSAAASSPRRPPVCCAALVGSRRAFCSR